MRIEQLYPFPHCELAAVLAPFTQLAEVIWCQEEPQNQGSWYQIRHRLNEPFRGERDVLYAGRAPSAAPATGLAKIHAVEQQELIVAALEANVSRDAHRDTERLAAVSPAPAAVAGKSR